MVAHAALSVAKVVGIQHMYKHVSVVGEPGSVQTEGCAELSLPPDAAQPAAGARPTHFSTRPSPHLYLSCPLPLLCSLLTHLCLYLASASPPAHLLLLSLPPLQWRWLCSTGVYHAVTTHGLKLWASFTSCPSSLRSLLLLAIAAPCCLHALCMLPAVVALTSPLP